MIFLRLFFDLHKLSKLRDKIKYKIFKSNIYYNDQCPICLENFIPFRHDIKDLTFHGSDKVVNKLFGTRIKYDINFYPSPTFTQVRENFVFKLGNKGIGYYYDPKYNKFTINNVIHSIDIVNDSRCKHAFHSNCLKKWVKKTIDCPLCKQPLV